MDMSEDDKALYFINLKDRKLYGLFVDTPARVPTAADVKSWVRTGRSLPQQTPFLSSL
ncbi:hypothetical protein ACFSUS_22755 [Spirosoma soli]|uniref:Uncharacterized protein n=1 Tax=Spirosoma soli TaxID=1770529 RepID=A0ABW5MB57_9BACT